MKHETREAWLEAAAAALRPIFQSAALPMPDSIKVSCGWPGGGSIKKRVGECWPAECSDTGRVEIFISPRIATPLKVLDVLTHECLHAAVGCACRHKGPFRQGMKALGLEGKPTSTVAGKILLVQLGGIAEDLGTYPHAVLTPVSKDQTQTTRMIKLTCSACGCIVRTTRQWLDQYNTWTCPCGGRMVVEEKP